MSIAVGDGFSAIEPQPEIDAITRTAPQNILCMESRHPIDCRRAAVRSRDPHCLA
jgi:hypothetical protein